MDKGEQINPGEPEDEEDLGPSPGDSLLHPIVFVAILITALNDHVLKQAFDNAWWTGKLSDVAGLTYFPLFLVGLWELAQRIFLRRVTPTKTALFVSVVVTALFFAGMKLWAPVTEVYRVVAGFGWWLLEAPVALLSGLEIPSIGKGYCLQDWTDILVYPVFLVPIWLGLRRVRASNSGQFVVTGKSLESDPTYER